SRPTSRSAPSSTRRRSPPTPTSSRRETSPARRASPRTRTGRGARASTTRSPTACRSTPSVSAPVPPLLLEPGPRLAELVLGVGELGHRGPLVLERELQLAPGDAGAGHPLRGLAGALRHLDGAVHHLQALLEEDPVAEPHRALEELLLGEAVGDARRR